MKTGRVLLSRDWVFLTFLALFSLGRFLPAQEASEPPEDTTAAYRNCGKCDGKGSENCPRCKGKKKIPQSCSACNGTGKTPCPSRICRESKRPFKCEICFDNKFRNCPTCKRAKSASVKCSKCSLRGEPTGKVLCSACRGKGKLPVVVVPPKLSPAVIADLTNRLQKCSGLIAQAVERFQDLRAQSEQLTVDRDEVEARIPSMEQLPKLSLGLSQSSKNVLEGWKAQGNALAEAKDSLEELEGMKLNAVSRLKEIEELLQKLDEIQGDERAQTYDSTKLHEKYADDFLRALHVRERQIALVKEGMSRYKTEVAEIDRKAKKEAEARKEKEAEQEEIARAFAKCQQAFASLPSAALFPEAQISLTEKAVQLPQELSVTVSFLDDQAEDARQVLKVKLSENYLKQIPRFIQEVFGAHDTVKTVTLSIRAQHIGRTGHGSLTPVQSFTFLKKDWAEFMTGGFKDDWRYLLSESQPKPKYPREEPGIYRFAGLLLWIGVCLAFAIALLGILRFFFKWP